MSLPCCQTNSTSFRIFFFFFFFQAEDGIRDLTVTGVQTCALPILLWPLLTGDRGVGGSAPATSQEESSVHVDPEAYKGRPVSEVRTELEGLGLARSEERRVGKECRSRWSPYH